MTRLLTIKEVRVGDFLDLGTSETLQVKNIVRETPHITIIDFTDFSTRAFDPTDKVRVKRESEQECTACQGDGVQWMSVGEIELGPCPSCDGR